MPANGDACFMNVDVRNVSRDGKPVECSASAAEIGDLLPGIYITGTVDLSGTVYRTDDTVVVKGSVRAVYRAECSRCLVEFEQAVVVPVENTFVVTDAKDDAEKALFSADNDVYVYDGFEIDIVPMVRHELILNAPVKPLCSVECKGLCPVCGIDRNRESCRCEEENIDPRLAVLKDILCEEPDQQ